MNINKSAILLAAAFIAVAAVSVRSQQEPAWAQRAREVSAKVNPASPTPPSAVILRLNESYHYVGSNGIVNEADGQVVEYATVSSNGPAITKGMNAADAIAMAVSNGRKCIFSDWGIAIFASGN